jgi:hypothetical protein
MFEINGEIMTTKDSFEIKTMITQFISIYVSKFGNTKLFP